MIRDREPLCTFSDSVFTTALNVIVKSSAAQQIDDHYQHSVHPGGRRSGIRYTSTAVLVALLVRFLAGLPYSLRGAMDTIGAFTPQQLSAVGMADQDCAAIHSDAAREYKRFHRFWALRMQPLDPDWDLPSRRMTNAEFKALLRKRSEQDRHRCAAADERLTRLINDLLYGSVDNQRPRRLRRRRRRRRNHHQHRRSRWHPRRQRRPLPRRLLDRQVLGTRERPHPAQHRKHRRTRRAAGNQSQRLRRRRHLRHPRGPPRRPARRTPGVHRNGRARTHRRQHPRPGHRAGPCPPHRPGRPPRRPYPVASADRRHGLQQQNRIRRAHAHHPLLTGGALPQPLVGELPQCQPARCTRRATPGAHPLRRSVLLPRGRRPYSRAPHPEDRRTAQARQLPQPRSPPARHLPLPDGPPHPTHPRRRPARQTTPGRGRTHRRKSPSGLPGSTRRRQMPAEAGIAEHRHRWDTAGPT